MTYNGKTSTRDFTKGKTQSIDTLRGVAVILMLLYHFLVWLLRTSARGDFFFTLRLLATFFAPSTFFIITGVTLTFCLTVSAFALPMSFLLHTLGIQIDRYPPSISYIVLSVGVTLLILAALFWWQDSCGHKTLVLKPIMVYGQYALPIYISHYFVFKIIEIFGLRGQSNLYSSLIISLLFMIIIYFIVVFIAPTARKIS